MKRLLSLAIAVGCVAVFCAPGWSVPLLQMTDPILAIDTDPPTSMPRMSAYPGGEAPANALDGLQATKYLNFGTLNTGYIVTPQPPAASIVQSLQFRTANDAEGRDPTSWRLWGTNDPITSTEHSTGDAENWSLIAEGPVALPAARQTLGPLLPFPNSNGYTSYRLVFPTIKQYPAANSMQIADVFMFKDMAGTDPIVTTDFDPVIAVHVEPRGVETPDSRSPTAETVERLLDGDATYVRGAGTFLTKYLNFGRQNSGFIVTPAAGPSIVTSFQMTTADDAPGRDPAMWELYGTNEPIVSTNHSRGNGENWELIDSGSVDLPPERQTAGPTVTVDNTTAFASYRMIFTAVKDNTIPPAMASTDSMQLAGIQFFGDLAGGLPGDFNGDGKVDTADYVVWRKNNGTQAGYDMWRTNFGRTAGSGSGLGGSAAVPEPGAVGLALLALVTAGGMHLRHYRDFDRLRE